MKYFKLGKEKIYSGNLILINADYPLRNLYANDLIPVNCSFPRILMKREAANILQLILEKISANNSIVPVSGYRTADEQKEIYCRSLENRGEEFTRKYVALPYHSEHQSGLAIDLGLNNDSIDYICPDFPYEGICNEFREIAPYYGFIERYGKNKEQITGISHEPWHFRYVGYPHSIIMYENSFTLEEYIDFIKSFKDNFRYSLKKDIETEIEVYYVPADTSKTTIIPMPSEPIYQLSGNNIDGFIVTVWRKISEQK